MIKTICNTSKRLLLLAVLLLTGMAARAQGTVPFGCGNVGYQVMVVPGSNPASYNMYSYDIHTGTQTQLFTFPGGVTVNALGYNPTDNFMYVYKSGGGGNQLYKIGADGYTTITITGLPATVPIPATAGGGSAVGYNMADITDDGYMLLANGNSNAYYYVDLNPSRPATYGKLVNPSTGTASTAANTFTGAGGTTGLSVQYAGDVAYNKADGMFYTIVTYPTANPNTYQLRKINAKTGVVTNIGAITGSGTNNTGNGYGSLFFDATGTLYGFFNPVGKYYSIPLTAGAVTQVGGSYTPNGSNDGAICPKAVFNYINISGNVFNDMNGLSDNTVNGTGINPGGLNAALWDIAAGKVLDVVPVNPNGTFTLAGSPNKTYDVIITTASPGIGDVTKPIASLPSNWINTGEHLGANAGSDGTANGVLAGVAVATTDITNVNFGINQPPVAVNDTLANQAQGTAATVPNILGNDTDPGGTLRADSITLRPSSINVPGVTYTVDAQGDTVSVTVPGQGTWNLNSTNGNVTFTPQSGFFGNPTPIDYSVADAAGLNSNTGTIVVTYSHAPVATNDVGTTVKNTPLNGNVATNDLCGIDAPCNYSPLSSGSPAHGTVAVNADGTYTYTPNTGFTGTDTFSYVVCSSGTPVQCDTAQVVITVKGVPVAVNDSVTAAFNTPISSTVATNDTCPAGGGTCTYAAGNSPANGTVTMNADGSYTYTPNTGFTGTDSFTYTICDAAVPTAHCDTATVYVTIQSPPIANNDVNTTTVNTPVSGDVTGNDVCGPNTPCSHSIPTGGDPAHGTVAMNADGTYTYTPNTGFTGTDTFTYTVCDAATPTPKCDTAVVTITIEGVPVAVNDSATTAINTPVSNTVATNDTCTAGGTCTYAAGSSPGNGTVTMNADGSYTYTPNTGFIGTDSFTYTICDAAVPTAHCDTATVYLTIQGVPVAVNDSATTAINMPVSNTVATNDTCTAGGTCTYAAGNSPANGTVTVNSDGSYTYTPNSGFTGTDSFTYTICDAAVPTAHCDTATVYLTIQGVPVAVNDSATTAINTPVSNTVATNDTCTAGGTCTYAAGNSPGNGTVTVNADGSYTYTPNTGFTGTDSFTYTICDAAVPTAHCDTATVYLTIQGVPVAVNDSATTAINTPISNTVATNDTCTAGGTCTYAAGNSPANGTVTVNSDGSYTYTPNTGFTGTDSFTYTICDAAVPTAHCDTATVYLTIQGVPVAVNDSATTAINMPVSNTVATNDTCTAGGTCTYGLNNTPANGTVTVNSDGSYTYTPNTGFTGTDSFTYTICDAAVPTAHCDTATVYLTIQGVPIAVNDSATTAINMPVSNTVATNDTCTAGGTCTYAAGNTPANGTVTVNSDGSYTYTPNTGFTGTDSFTYTICDAAVPTAHCDTATVYLTIQGVPIAVNDSATTAINTPVSNTVATNDTCTAGGTCTYAAGNSPANGTVTMNANGSYTYTPNTGFTGTDSFTYTICDAAVPTAHCDTATVYLTIQGVPVAVNDSATTAINMPVSNTVATNDTCTAGGTCTYGLNNTPANGTVTVNSDGSYTYTPNTGFTGTDSFTYTICDAAVPTAHCDTATVYLTIQGVPVAVNDSATTAINMPVSNTVATNDTCTAGGTCTYAAGNTPANGTVTVNSDGSYTYTPNSGFTGTDSFTYTICDAAVPTAHCDTATVYLTIQGVPVAVNDSATTAINMPVSNTVATNDTCTAGGTCTYAAGNSPGNGTVTMNADGSYTYTPNAGFTGTDSFTYTICDAAVPTAHCDTATVYLTIQGVPVAVNDSATTAINMPVSNTVATNDTCTAGGTCTYGLNNTPANGTVTVNADGSYTYTPNTGFTGTDSFTYTICDAAVPTAHCDTATVYLTIQGVPVAVNDSATTAINTPVSNTVATNDTCTAGGTCTYAAGSSPGNGTVTMNADGTYTYTPNTGFTGTDSFTYTICDAAVPTAHCDTATVYLTIQGVPVAVNDTASTPMNTPISSSVTANDTCRTGPCSYSPLSSDPPANGTVTVNSDGTYTYTPNTGFTGTDTFSYVLCNGSNPVLCDTAQVSITVSNPLPADLLSFTAKAQADCEVLLSWMTGVELSFDRFDIEWGTDGVKFVPVSSVPAKGSGSSYSYLYRHGVKGINYFRLKETDRDGSYRYSRIATANLGCAPERKIMVYPTVHNGYVTVEGLQAGESVTVYDMKGISVLQAKANGPVVKLNLAHTAVGHYMVVVHTASGERMSYKIVKG